MSDRQPFIYRTWGAFFASILQLVAVVAIGYLVIYLGVRWILLPLFRWIF